MDIANPASAYFFLSDDAHDELSGRGRKKMKCQSCGHRFAGGSYESRPECFSLDTSEMADERDEFKLARYLDRISNNPCHQKAEICLTSPRR